MYLPSKRVRRVCDVAPFFQNSYNIQFFLLYQQLNYLKFFKFDITLRFFACTIIIVYENKRERFEVGAQAIFKEEIKYDNNNNNNSNNNRSTNYSTEKKIETAATTTSSPITNHFGIFPKICCTFRFFVYFGYFWVLFLIFIWTQPRCLHSMDDRPFIVAIVFGIEFVRFHPAWNSRFGDCMPKPTRSINKFACVLFKFSFFCIRNSPNE